MKRKIYLGPVAPPCFGPSVKNSIIIEELKKTEKNLLVLNSGSKWNLIIFLLLYPFAQATIIALSKRGRSIITPYLIVINKFLGLLKIKKKVIFMPMGGTLDKEISQGLSGKLIKKGIENFTVTFVETKGLKSKLESLKLPNIKYLPNMKDIKSTDYTRPSTRKLVYISRIREIKGVLDLINAVKNIEAYFDVELDIYGSIEKGFEKDFFREINESKSIKYLGELNYLEITEVIKGYGIFIFPTKATTEGFPGALIDAFEHGLGIISSDISYNEEIISNGKNGLIFKNGDIVDLEKKIIKLLKDEELYNNISKGSYESRKDYDVKSLIQNIIREIK